MVNLGLAYFGIAIGAGLCLIGAGFGIAKCASAALEGAARQPESAGSLQLMMIIAAAMIEGLGLFALVIAFQAVGALNGGVAASSGPAPVAQTAPHRG